MTRLPILVFGGVGFALVARAALFYQGDDAFAFGLVLLIGALLVCGVVELLVRATRAARLTGEVRALPRPATTEAVEGASATVKALLRARIAGIAPPTSAPLFTSYLLGLLVMIGLIGTFMGLFETLRGAREALTASGDVAALREGLASPMSGLTRAFGTSAAGVSSSATLGLALVFLRRAEAAFGAAIAAYAAGPLAGITQAGRQLAALEALARQGEAMPIAAEALRDATARLAKLERGLAEAQVKAGEVGAAAILGASDAIRRDLATAASRAAELSAQAIEPVAKAIVEQAAGLAQAQAAALEGRTLDVIAALEGQRDDAAAHFAKLGAAADRAEQARGEALDARTRAIVDALGMQRLEAEREIAAIGEASSRAEQARGEALAAATRQILEALDAQRLGAQSEIAALSVAMEEAEKARGASLDARTAAITDALAAQRSEGAKQIAALGEAIDAAERARGEALDTRTLAILEGLEAQRGDAKAHVAALAASIDAAERARGASLDARTTAIVEALSAQRSDAERQIAALGAALDAAEEARGEALDARTRAILEGLEAQRSDAKAHVTALSGALDAAEKARGEALDTRALAILEALEAQRAEAKAHVSALAAAIEAAEQARVGSLDARTQAMVGSLDARTQAIVGSLDAQRTEGQAQITALGEAMDRAEKARVAALDTRTLELFEALDAQRRTAAAQFAALAEAVDRAEHVRVAAQDARTEKIASVLDERARGLAEDRAALALAVEEREARLVARIEEAWKALDRVQEAAEARIGAAAVAIVASVSVEADRLRAMEVTRAEEAAARVGAIDAMLRDHLAALGDALTEPLALAAEAAGAAPLAAAKLIDAEAARIAARAASEASRDVRLDALVEQLGMTALAIDEVRVTGVTRIDAFAAASEARATRDEASAEERLAGVIARFEDVLAKQAERMATYEATIEEGRVAAAGALGERLEEHARVLAGSLDGTASVVREAADLLRSGGVEMAAVSEAFGSAVDRYRQAGERWLDGLVAVEDAIERKAIGEASDLLGVYLDQTREVFEKTLEFQRELFFELRALQARKSA